MRSQQEIKDQIERVHKSQCDITGMQRLTLVHKLEFKNAKPYLKPNKLNQETENLWPKYNRLDKQGLLAEIAEQVDYTYMLMADKEWVKVFASMEIILCKVWLLGPQKDKFLKIFVPEILKSKEDCGRSAMKKLCEEFGINWNLMERRYGISGIIIPE